MGIEVDDRWLFTTQFANDQVIKTNYKDNMQYMIHKLMEEYR